METLFVAHHRNDDLAHAAWAVELAEEEVLPATESESSIDYGNELRGADDPRFQMRIAVAVLSVVFPHPLGDVLFEHRNDVALHGVVPVLLNHDPGGGSLYEDVSQSAAGSALGDRFGHSVGYVHQLFSSARRDFNRVLHTATVAQNIGGCNRGSAHLVPLILCLIILHAIMRILHRG